MKIILPLYYGWLIVLEWLFISGLMDILTEINGVSSYLTLCFYSIMIYMVTLFLIYPAMRWNKYLLWIYEKILCAPVPIIIKGMHYYINIFIIIIYIMMFMFIPLMIWKVIPNTYEFKRCNFIFRMYYTSCIFLL